MPKIGDLIKRARKAAGWRQEELAERLGVTDGLISMWENGKSVPPNAMRVELSMLFDIRVTDLMPELRAIGLPHLDSKMIALLNKLSKWPVPRRNALIDGILGLEDPELDDDVLRSIVAAHPPKAARRKAKAR